MGKTTYHFICKVTDTINEDQLIASSYCDVSTTKQAEEYFKKDKSIKRYIGNMRYKIHFRQNAILLQDNFDWIQQWKKQK